MPVGEASVRHHTSAVMARLPDPREDLHVAISSHRRTPQRGASGSAAGGAEARNASRRRVLIGPADIALTRIPWPEVGCQVLDGRLERGLGNPHHLVIGKHSIASQVCERDDAAAAPAFHEGHRTAREGDERVGTDIERELEPFARRLRERTVEIFPLRERGTVDEEVEAANSRSISV